MKKILFFVICFTTLFLNQSYGQSRSEYIEMGTYWSNKKNYNKAIQVYDEALAKYNNDAELLILRGEAKTKLSLSFNMENTHIPTQKNKMYESALSDFNSAIKINDKFCQAYHSRGFLYTNFQEYDKAIQDYTRLLACTDSKEDSVEAFVNRGACKLRKGNLDESLQDFNEALKIDSNDYGIYSNISYIFSEQGDYDKAEEYLKKAFSIDSTQINILNNLGFLKIQQGDFKQADTIYEKLFKMNPEDPFVLNNLGYVQCKLGDIQTGLKNINRSIALYPDNAYAYKYRGMVRLDLKQNTDACSDFEKAVSLGYSKTYGDDILDLVKRNCHQPR